jgi:hypothetical protein
VCIVGFLGLGCSSEQGIGVLKEASPPGALTLADVDPNPVPVVDEDADPWNLVPRPIRIPEVPSQPEEPEPDEEEEYEDIGIEMMIEAVLQRSRWGDSLGRCQVHVAFRRVQDEAEAAPLGDAPAGSEGAIHIELPSDAGVCLYTDLTPPEVDLGEEVPEDEMIDEPVPGGDPDADDWYLSGDIEGGEEIYIHSWDTTFVLTRQEVAHGELRYELEGCDESVFPFDQVFDLEVPYLEDVEIPGFFMEEAIGVGHDIRISGPVPARTVETYFHHQGAPIDFTWDELGDAPVIGDQPLVAQRMIFVRNHFEGEHVPFEALACRPDGSEMTLPAADLEGLESNPDIDTEDYYMALQIDTVYELPEFMTPWGQSVMSRSTVSDSGEVHLYWSE